MLQESSLDVEVEQNRILWWEKKPQSPQSDDIEVNREKGSRGYNKWRNNVNMHNTVHFLSQKTNMVRDFFVFC